MYLFIPAQMPTVDINWVTELRVDLNTVVSKVNAWTRTGKGDITELLLAEIDMFRRKLHLTDGAGEWYFEYLDDMEKYVVSGDCPTHGKW